MWFIVEVEMGFEEYPSHHPLPVFIYHGYYNVSLL